jgi:sec-independent protein translocase protein TatC
MTDTHDKKASDAKAKEPPKDPPDSDGGDDARMTFTEHLAELRVRIIRSGVALVLCMGVCYIFSDFLFDLVRGPLKDVPGINWESLNMIEGFSTKIRLAGYGGFVLALPYLVYHICAFVFPGLKPNERRAVGTLLAGGSTLLVSGVALAHRGILPIVLPYLTAFNPEGVDQKLRLNENVGMLFKFYLGFGIAFQFPLAVLVLVYLELLDPASLKAYRRFVIVGIAVLSAVLTPPEPISMILMGGPLVLLYEVSIWLSYIVVARKKRKRAKEEKRERKRRAKAGKKAKPAEDQKSSGKPEALPEPVEDSGEEENTD